MGTDIKYRAEIVLCEQSTVRGCGSSNYSSIHLKNQLYEYQLEVYAKFNAYRFIDICDFIIYYVLAKLNYFYSQ